MPKIKIVPSMAFDAVCFIQQRSRANRHTPEQDAFIEKINKLCEGKLEEDCLGMSTLCLVLSAYHENAGFENYTLDDLINMFKKPDDMRDIVKSRISNEFLASYVYPMLDWLADDGWSEKYTGMIGVLKEIGFDKLWKIDLLPVILEDIKINEASIENIKIDGMFSDIQKLKQCEPLGGVKIYVSSMSYPVSFTLYGGNYLQCVQSKAGTGMISHELMHGFATQELTDLYLDYVKSIKYLTEQHDKLINEHSSGNEEEFVAAAEHYMRMKHGGENKKDLLKRARENYNGCMPTSVFLFDLLSREPETPDGYADWLVGVFKNNKLPKKAIERNLDIISPREAIEVYHDKMFDCFKRMIEQAVKIRAGKSFDIEKRIESIINEKFEDITKSGKSVYFAQERQNLPNALKVKELCVDNLYINIAEFENNEKAMYDTLIYSGTNIDVPSEQINGRWCPPYCVNILHLIGQTPITASVSFIKDNFRVSFTARCPDYVSSGAEYPVNLKEMHEYWESKKGKPREEILKREAELGIPHYEEFCVKYSEEILAAQKKIEDIIMKL